MDLWKTLKINKMDIKYLLYEDGTDEVFKAPIANLRDACSATNQI